MHSVAPEPLGHVQGVVSCLEFLPGLSVTVDEGSLSHIWITVVAQIHVDDFLLWIWFDRRVSHGIAPGPLSWNLAVSRGPLTSVKSCLCNIPLRTTGLTFLEYLPFAVTLAHSRLNRQRQDRYNGNSSSGPSPWSDITVAAPWPPCRTLRSVSRRPGARRPALCQCSPPAFPNLLCSLQCHYSWIFALENHSLKLAALLTGESAS